MPPLSHAALLGALSSHLRLRTRPLVDAAPRMGAPFVLYWMRVAVRVDENAALDAAVEAANALGLPVLVYQGLSERYPYASDRHHTFALEGARDVAEALDAMQIAYALHVERPGARAPYLRRLAEQAALVVTEEMPVPPLQRWTAVLAKQLGEAAAPAPLWTVDASCVVSMTQTTKRFERAYAFRNATKALAAAALSTPWPTVSPRIDRGQVPPLPFTPIDPRGLDDAALARLVASCAIDHGVAPVRELRGGSRAGYARWQRFRDGALRNYARDRNDPLVDGTSRLSPYLHHGHVSALRLSREAAEAGGPGADKFLDELLVWREAAFHYAAHTPPGELHTDDALPGWARATVAEHATDPRSPASLETLARGRTGDVLWDSAQRSLVAHGELHNNVRMTWGKAILAWSPDAAAARERLVELNHRYALDGRDPASYGGLYWCLGLFDRPFPPARPIEGLLRPRPLLQHAERLDVAAYAHQIARPAVGRARRVAVVGGGLAGLACARVLQDHNVEVVVFDKGRASGGRLATRRVGGGSFDLGAQYFTARDPRFLRLLAAWIDDGVVAPWLGRVGACCGSGPDAGLVRETERQSRYVAVPGMSQLARHFARDLRVSHGHRVDRLIPTSNTGGIQIRGLRATDGATLPPRQGGPAGDEDLGVFDAVVVCLPAPQAADLLEDVGSPLAAHARAVPFEPCYAVGLTAGAGAQALRALTFDGVFIGREGREDGSCLSWVARESSKPGRPPGERWTLHASAHWSRVQGDRARDEVGREMIAELARLFDVGPLDDVESFVHRWGQARAATAHAQAAESTASQAPALFDEDQRIGLGGDWAAGGRVEGAFLSGVALAGRVLGKVF